MSGRISKIKSPTILDTKNELVQPHHSRQVQSLVLTVFASSSGQSVVAEAVPTLIAAPTSAVEPRQDLTTEYLTLVHNESTRSSAAYSRERTWPTLNPCDVPEGLA